MAKAGIYDEVPFNRGTSCGVSMERPRADKIAGARHNLPGSIILVHGVNDVGTSYDAVETGLCAGLTERLCGYLKPASYRMPTKADTKVAEDDPDAVFYKRQVTEDTHSPIIPFYWGFREDKNFVRSGKVTKHGQALDRYGNRLDKDYSKGGGPFANATSTLPDMWNRGKSGVKGALDFAQRDATHPVMNNPGRLYMILAARRLAALITMIRDYDNNETVSIVAHSQGCMVSLLAQAFLLDPAILKEQANARPADTLILCNPPYSLVDDMPIGASLVEGFSGEDAAMAGRHSVLSGGQTLHARLTTLVNIVNGVQKNKHLSPAMADLPNTAKHCGVVGGKWEAGADRDNRGKVYLYFSPEDMTVALANMQGIGWQGVPDYARGRKVELKPLVLESISEGPMETGAMVETAAQVIRRPLSELGPGFFQRVFTMKRRPDFHNGAPVLIGKKCPPHDFSLRGKGEDDQAHTEVSDSWLSKHGIRGRLSEQGKPPHDASADEQARFHLRKINGESLPKAVVASLCEGALVDAQGRQGAREFIDPIDAAISVTSDYGIARKWDCIPNPLFGQDTVKYSADSLIHSPAPHRYAGRIAHAGTLRFAVQESRNRGKLNDEQYEIFDAFVCMDDGRIPRPIQPAKLLILRGETAKEARLRWQGTSVPRSFHGAIYGGAKNHSQVTAYDVAIGGGYASTHPLFYAYLCAVADWRLKKPVKDDVLRPEILKWSSFRQRFDVYWKDEPKWRKAIIEGNVDYYSTGALPNCLPLLPEGLPKTVVSETLNSRRIVAKEKGT